MSRTIAHQPDQRTEGPRRAPRRPRYSDTRAAAHRIALAIIADALDGEASDGCRR